MDVLIEKARSEDAAELLEYLKAIGGETDNLTFGAEGLPFAVEEEKAYLHALEDSAHSVIFVARVGGKIVGNASFSGSSRERIKHRGELALSVRKEAWGNDIGTMLMEKIIQFAKETAHAEIIQLEVRSDNARAIRLYEKFGFVKIGQFHGLLKINGELIDCDLMNLYL